MDSRNKSILIPVLSGIGKATALRWRSTARTSRLRPASAKR